MLSYQHLYHAGNLADVHKHALLAWMLDYLTRKDKPLSYLESHAGRGLYDLAAPEAVKTGEAAQGVERLARAFAPDHPYRRALDTTRARHGRRAYPGSPLIAATLLRATDTIHLAERHPREHAALAEAMLPYPARVHHADGFSRIRELTPPTPRRGLLLIDPSYETTADYDGMARFVAQIARKWNVGILALWYPILETPRHLGMVTALAAACPEALRHEVRFPPAREGHRMVGSGLFVVNPPWGLAEETTRLDVLFGTLAR
ncbi:MAG: 23S rRNA (adenine(2030)-N(6))-methyltransferase RlmJ [Pararhodobacter sp.]